MKLRRPDDLAGDFWGGLASMLVALPSAIAFGVTIFAPLGGTSAAQGAIAGILGTTALGLVAPAFGGTRRLITGPSAPAAAVMSALAIQLVQNGIAARTALVMLALVAVGCGVLQIVFGVVRLGRLIKYMPYPVASGYLSGVGLVIIVSQVPKLLGVPKGAHFMAALGSPTLWSWHSIVVGVVTMAVMLTAGRVTKVVPAAILGLLAGVLAYFALGLTDSSMLTLQDNPYVVGPIATGGGSFLGTLTGRWQGIGGLDAAQVQMLITPAFTLAVLLSIDTLKTSVVLDALTRTRHDSNRELIGQGLANLASTVVGGIPGSGQMGATLVNMSSGGQTRLSGLVEGGLALIAFLVLGKLVAWMPIAGLAGILIVLGYRMLDLNSLGLLRSRSTILDFIVIASVVVVTMTVSLIAASEIGIGLAVLLFIREQIGGSIVARRAHGNQMFSKQVRLQEEMAVLEKRGERTAIFELQGSLFFGTTDQLFGMLADDIETADYIILDFRRVQTVDVTAAHMLEQIEDVLTEREALLIFSDLPRSLPSGRDMQQYFDEVGLVKSEHHARVFDELDEALEWVESRILHEAGLERTEETPLELREMDLFKERKEKTIVALEACMDKRSFKAGERIFARGDAGDELFLIRRGAVRIVLPLGGEEEHHLATFRRGDFFGEMSFLDRDLRSADARAEVDTEIFALSRERFDAFAPEHKRIAIQLLQGLARALAVRLRYTNAELRALTR